MNTYPANRYTQFITPLGGMIALAGFFLPWIAIGAFRYNKSGFSFFATEHIIPPAPLIAMAFITSVVIVGLSLYMVIRRTPWKSSLPILISSGIGLAILLDAFLLYVKIAPTRNSDFSYTGKFGFWGTIIGFVVAIIGVFFVRQESINGNSEVVVDVKKPWSMVHAGGIVALFCFFMPWEGIGPLSGWSGFDIINFDLMKQQSLITIAFIASILTVGISFYTLVMGTHWKLWKPILVCIGLGLGLLLSYAINFYVQEMIYVQTINSVNMLEEGGKEITGTGRSIKLGFWGAVIGYVIAALGLLWIKLEKTNKRVEIPAESG